MNEEMKNQRMTVPTPLGDIKVIVSPDSENPGIWVSVNNNELVLVEYDFAMEKHIIRVWDSEDEDDDYIFRHDVVEQKEEEK